MRRVTQAALHGLGSAAWLRTLAARLGVRPDGALARRFVAGETTAEAIAVARRLADARLSCTLDHLSGPVTTLEAAHRASRAYLGVLADIAAAGIDRNVTLTLTRFGLLVDRATCVDSLRRILDAARHDHFFVRIAMEESRYTQATLDVFETLWQQDYRNAGIVVQAALPRSLEDARRLVRLGASIRLVKGGYPEPRRAAYRKPSDVRRAFLEIMRLLLVEGASPAVATHDPALIQETRRFAASQGIAPARFELQMHYGVRRDLQAMLAGGGYRVRIGVPFGREWLRYVMRRLGDRPASALLPFPSSPPRRAG